MAIVWIDWTHPVFGSGFGVEHTDPDTGTRWVLVERDCEAAEAGALLLAWSAASLHPGASMRVCDGRIWLTAYANAADLTGNFAFSEEAPLV